MPYRRERVVPDHGLCPRCHGTHDRLLPVGAALDGTACAREYLVCAPCGTVWLNPSPRPLAKPPGPQETADNLVELARLEEVIPAFEPVTVEVEAHADADADPDPPEDTDERSVEVVMRTAITPAQRVDEGPLESFEEAVNHLRKHYRQQSDSADGVTFLLTLSAEPPA